jgi:hypothetical protein
VDLDANVLLRHLTIRREGKGSIQVDTYHLYIGSQTSFKHAHPYHRHKRLPIERQVLPVDLYSPNSASFDFLRPYATATASNSSKSVPSRNSNLAVRPLIIPRKSIPEPVDRYAGPDLFRRDREDRDRPSHSAFPFVNPFTSDKHQNQPMPPTSQLVTPKGRLKSLANSRFKTIRGGIPTPTIRQNTISVAEPRQDHLNVSYGSNFRPGTGNAPTDRSGLTRNGSLAVPPRSVLQGQTICDTFFFPRS